MNGIFLSNHNDKKQKTWNSLVVDRDCSMLGLCDFDKYKTIFFFLINDETRGMEILFF